MGNIQHGVWLGLLLAVAAVLPDTPDPGPSNLDSDPKILQESSIVLNTKQGKIRGSTVNYSGFTYTRFLGVPYAVPPTDQRRFAEPEKHMGWPLSRVWNATYFRPSCIQDTETFLKTSNHHYGNVDKADKVETSEDCLYLNLFIPRNLSQVEHINTLALSVMILIHGWDFENELAQLHEGWRLAGRGDVIVATVEYRVGVFGFFSLQDEAARGNYGLLDQKMAMHWIWDNIREFGGNPERITVFGGSTGAISIGFHVVSPLSRGMFVRAISQSGTMLTPSGLQVNPLKSARALAESLSCPISPHKDTLACLRHVSAEVLLETSRSLSPLTGGWRPVIDGKFLPDHPLKLLDQGQFNPVDYVLGINSHDGYEVHKQLNFDLNKGMSQDDFEDLMTHYLLKYYDKNADVIHSAMLLEYSSCGQNFSQLGRHLVDFMTDLVYASPVEMTARLMTRRGERKVYFYEFAHKSSLAKERRPWYVSATHGDEMPYVLGDVTDATPAEVKLSHAMMSAWANFAKNGDPNPVVPGLSWEQYNVAQGKYAYFTADLGAQSSQSALRARKMAFWNSYVDQLRRATPCKNERDTCERTVRPVKERESHAFLTLWILIGVCVILLVIIALLVAKMRLPSKQWQKCCPCFYPVEKETNVQEVERKKLHPLPYYEEPT